jgi:hypothetical protein
MNLENTRKFKCTVNASVTSADTTRGSDKEYDGISSKSVVPAKKS